MSRWFASAYRAHGWVRRIVATNRLCIDGDAALQWAHSVAISGRSAFAAGDRTLGNISAPRRTCLGLLLCICLPLLSIARTALAAQDAAPSPATATLKKDATVDAEEQELWLSVQFNRNGPTEVVLFLREKGGRLFAREEDVRRWRLRVPNVSALTHNNESYYPLDTFAGLSYQVDESTQAIFLDAPPDLFQRTNVNGQTDSHFRVPAPAPLGAFFNYDVSSQNTGGRTQTSGFFEADMFNAAGVGGTSFLARDFGTSQGLTRLDTTWTQDQPADLASLRLGDAITGGGEHG